MSEYLGMLAPSAGVAVVVHDDDVHPFPDTESHLAGVGQDTAIGVQPWMKKHINMLSPCLTSAPSAVPLHYSGAYTVENCRRSCLLQTIQTQCSCSDDVTATQADQCVLNNRDQVLCVQKVRYMYAHGRLVCQQQCLPACKQKSFYTFSSASELPSSSYGPILNKITAISSADNSSLLRVHVYMKSLDEVIVSDLAYPEMLMTPGGKVKKHPTSSLRTDINGAADPFLFDKSEYFSTLSGPRDFRTMATFAKASDHSATRRWANPTTAELDTMAHPLSGLLMLCSFDGATCTTSDFTKVYNRQLGLCYTFNKTTTGPTLTSKSGYQAGLSDVVMTGSPGNPQTPPAVRKMKAAQLDSYPTWCHLREL